MSDETPERQPSHETTSDPSQLTVLDWFKSLFTGDPIEIPDHEEEPTPARPRGSTPEPVEAERSPSSNLWERRQDWLTPEKLRLPVALLLAFGAQFGLAQRSGSPALQAGAYLVAAVLLGWAFWAGDLDLPAGQEDKGRELTDQVRGRPLVIGLAFGGLTFLTAYGNQFRFITVVSWFLSMLFTFVALWHGEVPWKNWGNRLRAWISEPKIAIRWSSWDLVVLVALGVVAYFRFVSLSSVPFEMWSDHAEKLLDVRDVLNGEHRIFFPRNTGREAFQFYSAALVALVFDTGLSFLTLKIVTATAGFVALFFVYLLGKEIGGREAGLFAVLLAGMSFWPNIAARMGLRMPLNELAVAPAMFFLVRGLRHGRRNDFLWSGLAVGLGLHGYSTARILPLAILLGVGVYLLHKHERGARRRALIALGCLVLVSVIAFLPLMRVLVEMPDRVLYRALTRVGTLERAYPAPPLLQLAINMWDGLRMFAWNTGEIWVATVTSRPALDWVTGGLFHLGVALFAVRYIRSRRWDLLFLLLSIPVLLLPSALSLAFPNENPAPHRVTGAIVPVFVITGYMLAVTWRWIRDRAMSGRPGLSLAPVLILLVIVGLINHRLVFTTYAEQQRASTWNNSEAGRVMRGFANSIGRFENIFFIAYPHWMDSRLAALEAGAPLRDYSIPPEAISSLQIEPNRHHLFLLNPDDVGSVTELEQAYPSGVLSRYESAVPGRDFLMYLVPANGEHVIGPGS